MSTTAEQMTAITGRVSLEQAHDALMAERVKRELYDQQDDVADWAQVHAASLRLGPADRRFAELAEQERHDRVVDESAKHFRSRQSWFDAERWPDDIRAFDEMETTAGQEPLSLFTPHGKLAIAALALLLAWLCWLAPLGN